ncbi:MAG: hypothetical protein U0324_44700 [Polyangiales bacterium]
MTRKRRPPPAAPVRPAHGNLLTQRQLDHFLAHLRERGIATVECDLAGLQALVESLQARHGHATVRSALAAAGIATCVYCERAGKAAVATDNVEVDTGLRSVGDFVLTCDACRPKALAEGVGG